MHGPGGSSYLKDSVLMCIRCFYTYSEIYSEGTPGRPQVL